MHGFCGVSGQYCKVVSSPTSSHLSPRAFLFLHRTCSIKNFTTHQLDPKMILQKLLKFYGIYIGTSKKFPAFLKKPVTWNLFPIQKNKNIFDPRHLLRSIQENCASHRLGSTTFRPFAVGSTMAADNWEGGVVCGAPWWWWFDVNPLGMQKLTLPTMYIYVYIITQNIPWYESAASVYVL